MTSRDRLFLDESISHGTVRLRQLWSGDAEAVAAAIDKEILRWLPLLPNPYQLWHAETFCGQLAPAIQRSGSGIVKAVEVGDRFAGVIDLKKADWQGLSVEVGYWTAGWARGQGWTSAAVDMLSRWVLVEGGFRRVEIRAAVGNVASQPVAEKAGFLRERVLRWAGLTDDVPTDVVVLYRIQTDLDLEE